MPMQEDLSSSRCCAAAFNCTSSHLAAAQDVNLAAEMRGQVGWQCSHPLRCFFCCAGGCLLVGMTEVTWAALLYGCMSSSLAEETGLPFCPAGVREQLGEIIYKQVRMGWVNESSLVVRQIARL
jgi:hypothetical protein